MRRPSNPLQGRNANTVWALLAEGVQFAVGSAVFFLLLDRLGPAESGVYGAVLAIAVFGVPVTSLGVQSLLMQGMAAGEEFGELWAKSVKTICSSAVVTTLLATFFVRPWLLPEVGFTSFAYLFSAQVGLYAISELGVVAAQAHRQMSVAFAVRACSGALRLGAVVQFALADGSTLDQWAPYGFGAQAISAAAGLLIVRRVFGPWSRGVEVGFARLREGAVFAFGKSSAQVLDAQDRPMLVRLAANPAEAGYYNAGYRLVQMALMPIGALVRSTEADMFEAGARSVRDAAAVARKLSLQASFYAVFAGAILFAAAPIVPVALGPEWEEAAPVLRYLSVLPIIKALQIFAANALTGAGLQVLRNWVLAAAILLNAGLNLWLIPDFGWRGAVVATISAESFMAVSLWAALARPTPVRGAER